MYESYDTYIYNAVTIIIYVCVVVLYYSRGVRGRVCDKRAPSGGRTPRTSQVSYV